MMDETKFRKYVAYCRWVWLVGSVVSLVSAVVALLVLAGMLTAVLAVVTGVQAVLSIPAAIALPRGASWARITLMVLALLSIAGLYTAFKSRAWPSLVLNLALGSTYGVLVNKDFKTAYKQARAPNMSA